MTGQFSKVLQGIGGPTQVVKEFIWSHWVNLMLATWIRWRNLGRYRNNLVEQELIIRVTEFNWRSCICPKDFRKFI